MRLTAIVDILSSILNDLRGLPAKNEAQSGENLDELMYWEDYQRKYLEDEASPSFHYFGMQESMEHLRRKEVHLNLIVLHDGAFIVDQDGSSSCR